MPYRPSTIWLYGRLYYKTLYVQIKAGDVASLFTDGIGGSIFNAVLGGISLAKFHGGLIFYCVEVPGDSDCEVYEMQGKVNNLKVTI